MGVPGLWDILRPAGKLRSLTHLSVVDGFEANPEGKRGYRVGIDASIWFFHATYGREGENPELRTLFFRCARLMSMPFLPLFVFDGPKRPEMKRGKRITGKNHWMVQGMQEIITAFGFEWRMAPGEAEAELAYLNRIGVIDAVLSDDVDTFLFGAKTLIRNPSATLSGNRGHSMKNSAGRDDGNHAMIYRSSDILNHDDIKLTQGGLILIGILRGGDYCQEGLDGCGVAIAHGLAKCGFGDALLKAARTKSRDDLEDFLDGWRDEIRDELRTNSRGYLPRKSPKLSKSIPDEFPNVEVVLAYTIPVTSEAKGPGHKNAVVDWDKEPDLGKIAGLCEMYFEWGIKEIIIKRFRTVLWPSAVLRILRRAAIMKDRRAALLVSKGGGSGTVPETPRKNGKERGAPPGTPSSMIAEHFSTMRLDTPQGRRASILDEEDEDEEDPLIVRIHSSRRAASTDNVLEYRLEIAPAQLSGDDEGGKKGKKTKKPPPEPDSHLRIWLPACMVEIVEPEMVDEFEGVQRMKAEKKAAKGTGKARVGTSQKRASADHAAKRGKKAPVVVAEEEEESSSERSDVGGSQPAQVKVAAPPPVQKASKVTSKGNGRAPASSATTTDEFFAAKKTAAAASKKPSVATTSTAARVADLFKDIPPSPQHRAPIPKLSVLSDDDDEVPRPPHLSHASTKTTTRTTKSSSTTAISSRPTASRVLLSLLETRPSSSSAGPSGSSASTTSPSKARALRPFPINLEDMFEDEPVEPSPIDEDLFSTDRTSSGASSLRTRARSSLSSDSDGVSTLALQKSPRRSDKHASLRGTPTKRKGASLMQEEEESESESDFGQRAPSPSPLKGRTPTALDRWTSVSVSARREEEEESDRAPSPSPIRRRPLPPSKSGRPPNGARKPAPLPADLTIISISSDSEDDPTPPVRHSKPAPLQQARARLTQTASAPVSSLSSMLSTQPTSSSSQPTRKPPRRIYDPRDIIDLT
ncbi:hypothetical protein BD413DRAFT_668950 [Trametes elegans]|nr:hypothetical protein BD413DRAFT_668950 [Trametes elegans]